MSEVSQEESRRASGTPDAWPYSDAGVPSARGEGAVASTDEAATAIGVAILGKGGSAVDAAVATAFALAVVNPEAGGIGGSGYLLVRTPAGKVHSLDFRSTAPRGAATGLLLAGLQGRANASLLGHLAAAVPGIPAGLEEVHRRFGKLPWSDLVSPAIELAEGFAVRARFSRSFTSKAVDKLRQFDSAADIFLPLGSPPKVGDVFRQTELGETLERIRDCGAVDFYQGETAKRIADASQSGGGVLSLDDLVRYRPIWRYPIRVRYRDRTILSTPPSSSGGVVLAQMAGIVEKFDFSSSAQSPSERLHILMETFKRAFADRNEYLGDPAFEDLPLATLINPEYSQWRATSIGARATPSSEVAPGVKAFREGERTTHLSVIDGSGCAVALTLTLNTWYGSGVVAEGTGVLLNCDMDDFTLAAEAPNYFELIQGAANRLATGKRMLSAMTPTMVLGPGKSEELQYVLGTPGGATIPTTIFQILSHLIDERFTPDEAIAAPRFHHQHLPDRIEYEPGGMGDELGAELRERGHDLYERDEPIGDVQLVVVEEGGARVGYSDMRRGGSPGAC